MTFDIADLVGNLLNPVGTRAVLKVNGKAFNSWKSISVNRSLAQIAGTFSFTTSNRFAGDVSKWGFTTGDVCTVEIANELVITGYIDEIEDGYTLDSHDVTFTGRDKTSDLVDCDFDVFENENEFKNITFLQIIQRLCTPFDISVIIDTPLVFDSSLFKPIPDYKIETGERVYDQIVTLCQQYGVLPITIGDGNLLITRAGLVRTFDKLEVGVNIKANKLIQSDKDRYSIYYAEAPLKPSVWIPDKLTASGKLEDKYIKRTRPFIILVGEKSTDDTCQRRVAWECRIRAGASRKVETVVKGWTQKFGGIWPLNGIVPIKDPKIGIDRSFLIAGINLNLDSSGGELTSMSLVHPDTFTLKERIPVPNRKVSEWDKLN